jgi:hypothetical protein
MSAFHLLSVEFSTRGGFDSLLVYYFLFSSLSPGRNDRIPLPMHSFMFIVLLVIGGASEHIWTLSLRVGVGMLCFFNHRYVLAEHGRVDRSITSPGARLVHYRHSIHI